jgi:two-component system, OmpR family, response regulator
MNVLVVEDEERVLGVLARLLEREGYTVDAAATGNEALSKGLDSDYDAMILDVNIPKPDGFEVCSRLRSEGRWLPILMLTGRADVADRIRGLDSGADDYLPKPFSNDELLARLRALTRRHGAEGEPMRVGGLMLDPTTHTVTVDGEEKYLTAKEFDLLHLFMSHPGEVMTRTRILDSVWDFAYEGTSNVVDVYISYLRGKLDEEGEASVIESLRGVGYRLRT